MKALIPSEAMKKIFSENQNFSSRCQKAFLNNVVWFSNYTFLS